MRTNSPPELNGRAASTSVEMARLVAVIAALREHCPWTAALTHDSLTTYLLEESYELIEAVETAHGAEIANELGDILLQVVLHSRLAEEAGEFDLADVARGLTEKMIRRSPHVFRPDGTLQDSFPATIAEIEAGWERAKAKERATAVAAEGARAPGAAEPARAPGGSPFAGIPASLPALAMAQKTLERAARAGIAGPPAARPAAAGSAAGSPAAAGHLAGNLAGPSETEEELGKVLFDVVRLAQERGLDAERALRMAVREYQNR